MQGIRCDICGKFTSEKYVLTSTARIVFHRHDGDIAVDLCRICATIIAKGINRYNAGHVIDAEDLEEKSL